MRDGSGGAMAPDSDWDEDFDRSTGQPLTATLLAVVPVIAASVMLSAIEANPLQTLARTLGGALAVALVAWGIAYAVTIRRSNASWKIGSLLILIVAALLGGLGGMGYKFNLLRQDFSTLAEVRFLPSGDIVAPPGAEARGPMSRIFLDYMRATMADRRAMEARFVALGFPQLSSPDALLRNPAMLANCDRLLEAKAATAKTFSAGKARIGEVRKKIAALDIPTAMRDDVLKGFAQSGTVEALDSQRALLDAEIDEHRSVCQVLARRNWRAERGVFAFTSPADLARFNMSIDSIASIQQEAAQLQMKRLEALGRSQAQIRGALY